MTKTVRIENADQSNFPVCLTVQHQDSDGNWVDQPNPVQLDQPTHLATQYITSSRRLVIEERAAPPQPGT